LNALGKSLDHLLAWGGGGRETKQKDAKLSELYLDIGLAHELNHSITLALNRKGNLIIIRF
jgi:hypothetical protein